MKSLQLQPILVCLAPCRSSEQGQKNGHGLSTKIDRHRAAIVRNALSKPVRAAVEAGLFTEGTTFFDYGCGHGGDHKRIAQQGFVSNGWDPYYRPDTPAHRLRSSTWATSSMSLRIRQNGGRP